VGTFASNNDLTVAAALVGRTVHIFIHVDIVVGEDAEERAVRSSHMIILWMFLAGSLVNSDAYMEINAEPPAQHHVLLVRPLVYLGVRDMGPAGAPAGTGWDVRSQGDAKSPVQRPVQNAKRDAWGFVDIHVLHVLPAPHSHAQLAWKSLEWRRNQQLLPPNAKKLEERARKGRNPNLNKNPKTKICTLTRSKIVDAHLNSSCSMCS
jgi:hypothetical protein